MTSRIQKINESRITEEILSFSYEKLKLTRPQEGKEYKSFEYDICVRDNQNRVIGLIEAKYRSFSDRPTTDSLIASIIKLLYEWTLTFERDPKIKLILLIYVKQGLSEVNESFRNNLIERLKNFFQQFCSLCSDLTFEPEIINLEIKLNEDETGIKCNLKTDIEKKLSVYLFK